MNTGRVIVKTLIKVYDGITDVNGNPIPVKDSNNNNITKPNNIGDPDYIPSYIDYEVCPDFIHTPPPTTTTTNNQVTTTQTTTQPQVTTTTVNPCANFLITGLSLDCTGSLYNVLSIFGTGIINGSVNVTITQSSILYNQAVTFLNGVGYINLSKSISGSVAVQINQGNCGNTINYNILCGSTTTINNTTTQTTTTNQITTTQNQVVPCYNVVFTNSNNSPASIAYNCNGIVSEIIPANSCITRSSQNGNWALPSGVTANLNGTCVEVTTTQNNITTTTTQNPACISVVFRNPTNSIINVAYICGGIGYNVNVPANGCVTVNSENGNWVLNGCTSEVGGVCGGITTTANITTQPQLQPIYQTFSCIGGVIGAVQQTGFVGLSNGTVVNVNGTCHTITGVSNGTTNNVITQSFSNCNDCAGVSTTTSTTTTTNTTTNNTTTTNTTTSQCVQISSVQIVQI